MDQITRSDGYTQPPPYVALRIKAIQSLLVEKGLVAQDALDEVVDIYENRIGPKDGAAVIARAWVEPEFKARLLEDGIGTLAELGMTGFEGAHVLFVENTDQVHNVVVCTLCSCYPWAVLGLPPAWYKAPQYRSRVVLEPRKVLAEFGTTVPSEKEIRVWDSTAEIRYIVIPQRPSGTEGLSVDQLAELVNRDSMIGTRFATPYEGAAA
ncbi:nitrile hydratase subunit alpha [Saccharopolyspora phatthalungensis]|uniref:nitrile hydratase n=1 Tax=Saccharopolyspora phatthalungensis TaxID=664693 RepID=A0A840Q934_9PSEU|nr:nitrile hydratase subunit alpha [Saccharopolyspora phatthalungensis]MBB5157274.1 nitrile hydratase [Saccharopolyspora phatthalungensis]